DREAAGLFSRSAPDARILVLSWWNIVSQEARNAVARETGVSRDDDHHAALVETSLAMYAAPSCVRRDLIGDDGSARRAEYLILPVPDALRTRTGVLYRASGASIAIGERLMTGIMANLVEAVTLELLS